MRPAVVLLAAAGLLCAADDAREIVRRSVDVDRRNAKLAENYTFIERVEQREMDRQGRVARRTLKTYDVTLTEGSPYRRLIARDDRPLPPAEEAKERRKLERTIAERRAETPAQRARRLEESRKRRERQREFSREINDAYNFRLLGEETIEGRRAYVIEATPRPGYRPRTASSRFLAKTRGRLWIDAQSNEWIRVEGEVIDTISFVGFAWRLNAGSRFALENTRLNDEIWLPRHVSVTASVRLLLLKRIAGEWEITYRDHKKFQSDARIVAIQEPK